jgi:hypothetical protein
MNRNKLPRATKQRAAINGAIERANRPLNVQEILQVAEREVPNLGIATVYRNVKALTVAGKLKPVCGVGIAPCYGLPDIADRRATTLYQAGTSLFVEAPKGFVRESACEIVLGHIA